MARYSYGLFDSSADPWKISPLDDTYAVKMQRDMYEAQKKASELPRVADEIVRHAQRCNVSLDEIIRYLGFPTRQVTQYTTTSTAPVQPGAPTKKANLKSLIAHYYKARN